MIIITKVLSAFLLLTTLAEASWKCGFTACGSTPAPAPTGCPDTAETCKLNPCSKCCSQFFCSGSNYFAGCQPFCPNPAPTPAPVNKQPPSSSCYGMTCGCGNLPACGSSGGGGGGGGGGSHGGGTSVSKPKPKVEETKPKAKVVVVTKATVETKPKPKEKSNEKMLSPSRTPPHGPHDAYLAASSGPSPAGVVFGSALVFALAGLFVGEVRRNGWGRRRAVNVNTRALSEDSRANASASDTPYASA